MAPLTVSRFFRIQSVFREVARSTAKSSARLDHLKSHVYNKTWKKKDLLQYVKDNVFHECDKYIASCLPQGVALKKTSSWLDSPFILLSEADLNDLRSELGQILNLSEIHYAKYPSRNASGLLLVAKNYEAKRYFKKNATLSESHHRQIFEFLVVVLGKPKQNLNQVFAVKPVKSGNLFGTEILQLWDKSDKLRTVNYTHQVLSSTEYCSLLKVSVSADLRDCVRHILGSKCLTPVLGDWWNYKMRKSPFLGVPLVIKPDVERLESDMSLEAGLLTKLNLEPGEEKLIPIHVHLYSIKMPLKKKSLLHLSVPPPQYFQWTCHQLELHEIQQFCPKPS